MISIKKNIKLGIRNVLSKGNLFTPLWLVDLQYLKGSKGPSNWTA